MSTGFAVDPKLLADGVAIGETDLCVVLLMNDKRFPWFVLVPKVAGKSEIYDLDASQRAALMEESARFARAIMTLFRGDKCNIAALGNVVPQLHVHHIVRFKTDAAWPGPIWRFGQTELYGPGEIDAIRAKVHQALPFVR